MANNFLQLRNAVSRYLGQTVSTSNADHIKNIVNQGYRQVLDANGIHNWSFAKRSATLQLVVGQSSYSLPNDFLHIIGERFVYPNGANTLNVEERLPEEIAELQSSLAESNNPYYYAVRSKSYSVTAGSQWEVVFYPTPATAYTLTYRMMFVPPDLISDTDLPIGGDRLAAVIRQAVLGAAELIEEGKEGDQSAAASRMLAAAIDRDKREAPGSLGAYGQTSSSRRGSRSEGRITFINN